MAYRRKPKYCLLHEAVQLIAERLSAADRQTYADAAAARDEAREQLLEALFEGAIGAEGVRVYPDEEPPDEAPSVEYDEWLPINRGVWLHQKCEINENSHRLNAISVNWNDDYIEYYDSIDEWAGYGDSKIRLICGDIDREFPHMEPAPPSAPAATGEQAGRTGLPGRPSSAYLAQQEMHRRAEAEILCSTLAAEMRELCSWLRREHPDKPPVKPKSLGNNLRQEYWALRVPSQ